VSLLDALRSGVRIANNVTKPLQATVTYEHCNGSDQYGPTYDAPVPLLAIVDEKQQQVRTKAGILSASRCQLTFLDVAAVVAATGSDGYIRDIDLITLPDGSAGSILAVGGFVDALTGHAISTDVWL
jgi:hypothetical protein